MQTVTSSSAVIADPAGTGAIAVQVPQARWLRISVTRGGRTVVQVCFPSYAVLSLGDLVPEDARQGIVAAQVDLEEVAADAAARGCPPGELFAIASGEDAVRAWLA